METVHSHQDIKDPSQAYDALLAKGLYEEAEVLRRVTTRFGVEVLTALEIIALIDQAVAEPGPGALVNIYGDVADIAGVLAESVVPNGDTLTDSFGRGPLTQEEARQNMVGQLNAIFRVLDTSESLADLLLPAAIAGRTNQS